MPENWIEGSCKRIRTLLRKSKSVWRDFSGKEERERREQAQCTKREQLAHCSDLFPQVMQRVQTEKRCMGPGLE